MSKAENIKRKKVAIFNTGGSSINERENVITIINEDLNKLGLIGTDMFLPLKCKRKNIRWRTKY